MGPAGRVALVQYMVANNGVLYFNALIGVQPASPTTGRPLGRIPVGRSTVRLITARAIYLHVMLSSVEGECGPRLTAMRHAMRAHAGAQGRAERLRVPLDRGP